MQAQNSGFYKQQWRFIVTPQKRNSFLQDFVTWQFLLWILAYTWHGIYARPSQRVFRWIFDTWHGKLCETNDTSKTRASASLFLFHILASLDCFAINGSWYLAGPVAPDHEMSSQLNTWTYQCTDVYIYKHIYIYMYIVRYVYNYTCAYMNNINKWQPLLESIENCRGPWRSYFPWKKCLVWESTFQSIIIVIFW